ncbi:MAG TPA: PDZ domain-containing protein [Acidimicrobiia bacterium]
MTNGADEERAAVHQPNEAAEPTEPTSPAAAAGPPHAMEPPPPPDEGAAPAGGPPARGGWLVPKWVVAALVGVVAFGIIFGSAFAIGRATAPSGGENGRIERGFEGRPGRGNGNGNGNGNGSQLPQPTSGVFLGVSLQPATGNQQGAQVASVASGSPAAAAGLQANDVITAVDGTTVSSPADLARLVRSHQSGDQVTITYSRSGNSTDTQVQLGDRSSQNTPAS